MIVHTVQAFGQAHKLSVYPEFESPANTTPLAKLDKARLLLRKSRTLPEIKKIRDLAVAAKEYARAAKLGHEAMLLKSKNSLRRKP